MSEQNAQTKQSGLQYLMSVAQNALKTAEKQQYTQTIVLYTAMENTYHAVIPNAISAEKYAEKALIERLVAADDTEILWIVCMWHDGCLDLPSHAFRRMLCAMDCRNENAGIFILTDAGHTAVRLARTMQ